MTTHEMLKIILIRDLKMKETYADMYLKNNIPQALKHVAAHWWLYGIEAPEAPIVRRQILALEEKGQLEQLEILPDYTVREIANV